MIEFACPLCKARIKVRESSAGKAGKCPRCGEVLRIPKSSQGTKLNNVVDVSKSSKSPVEFDVMEAVKEELKKDPDLPDELESHFIDGSPMPLQRTKWVKTPKDDEPWYYGFLETFARWIMIANSVIAGLGIASLLILIAGLSVGDFISDDAKTTFVGYCLIGVLLILWELASVIFVYCFVFLAVDSARNLRALRKSQERITKDRIE